MIWIFFAIFMIVVSIGLLELLAAVFIDSLLEEKANREKMKIRREERLQDQLAALVTAVFAVFDQDDKGALSHEELDKALEYLDTDDIRSLLDQVEIDDDMLSRKGAPRKTTTTA